MTARYHPIVDTLWDDEALEGLTFEGKGFFCFLCSNRRVRPSGIYRVTDEQLAVDTGLAVRKVREYLGALVTRRRVVRDGAWIFVRGYFGRQPKGDRLLLGVKADIDDCSSVSVLTSFGERYPLHRKWSTDRLQKVNRPCSQLVPAEQYRAVQSSKAVPPLPPFAGGHVGELIEPPESADAPTSRKRPRAARTPRPLAARPPHASAGFQVFYDAYPRHVAPRHAEAAYKAALKRGAEPAQIMAALNAQLTELRSRDPLRIPYPATWLNGEHWRNEPEAATPDPYADFPELFDCSRCGGAHETRGACTDTVATLRRGEGKA